MALDPMDATWRLYRIGRSPKADAPPAAAGELEASIAAMLATLTAASAHPVLGVLAAARSAADSRDLWLKPATAEPPSAFEQRWRTALAAHALTAQPLKARS